MVFFWDTIQLGSMQAHWFYENGLKLILPQHIDSGHPPGFGIYLAGIWKVFGKTLPNSHLAMLPFLIGLVFQLYQLGRYFFSKSLALVFLAISVADPSILGQSVLMSPDIVLVFCFLTVVNGILLRRNWWILLAGLGLAAISMRGMMCLAALYVFSLINFVLLEKRPPVFRQLLQLLWPFLPGAILGLAFLIFHYLETGWIGFHADSPWALSFERVGLNDLIKNLVILVWRCLDFGRVFLVLIGLYLLWRFWKDRLSWNLKGKQILALLLSLILFLTPSFFVYKGVNAQRYLLPILLSINVLGFYLISHSGVRSLYKNYFLAIIFIGFLSGNLWIYPKKISQSWDSTLAHLPYYELRQEMIAFIKQTGIPFEQVGSVFPNLRSLDHTELNGSQERFARFDVDRNSFVFYSNVFNDFKDEEIDQLFGSWKVRKSLQKNGICVILFVK